MDIKLFEKQVLMKLGSPWKIAFLQLNQRDFVSLNVDFHPLTLRLIEDGDRIVLSTPIGQAARVEAFDIEIPLVQNEDGEAWIRADDASDLLILDFVGGFDFDDFEAFQHLAEWFVRLSQKLRDSSPDDLLTPMAV